MTKAFGEPDYIGNDSYYEHNQEMPAAVWVVDHNLNKYPSITVMGEDGQERVASPVHISRHRVEIHFSKPFAGTAVCS